MNIEQQSARKLKYYAQHLKGLSDEDKHTRFCHAVKDDGIDRFILSILYSLENHHIFAAREKGVTLGYVHLAKIDEHSWELAISVNADNQGKGIGNKLMAHAITWAKTHGIESMFMNCISDNKKIQHLARKYGLKTVSRDGGDISSKVVLPKATIVDRSYNFISEQSDIIKKISLLNGKLFSNLSNSNRNF
jgi:GNAT superfamily N-acetyltransferase